MPKEIDEITAAAIRAHVFPGCVVALVRVGERTVRAYGTTSYNGEEAKEDTVYDLASITKSIPVASLVLMLAKEGKIALSDLVRTWIPELQNDHAATIEDLLRYRVHGVQLSSIAHLSSRAFMQHVFESGFPELPGEERYTNLPAFLLGIILERVTGKALDDLARERLFEPLAMSTTYFPLADKYEHISRLASIAPTETEESGDVQGIPHDESARGFAREGKAVGHAGLFSNAHDLSNFVESILAGGYPEIVKGAHKGLGWSLNKGTFMGKYFGPRTFGKTGFTGTSIVIDTDRRVGIIVLSNRTYPVRPESDHGINGVRSAIHDAIFQAART